MVLESSSDLLIVRPSPAQTENETQMDDVIVLESRYELEVLSPSPSASEYDYNGYSAVLILRNNEYQIDTQITWKPRLPIDTDHPFVFFNCRIDSIEK